MFPTFSAFGRWISSHGYEVASVSVIVLVLYVVWFAAGVEAQTYNRFTGHDVTQWEALFTNLRLDCR